MVAYNIFLRLLLFTEILLLNLSFSQNVNIVRKQGPLSANFGGVTYLERSDLKIRLAPNDSSCKVTVLHNSAQPRTGRLYPAEFPCNFRENTVYYEHYGLPTHQSDTVGLLISYVTSKDEAITLPISLRVTFASKKASISLRNNPISVENFNGFSEPISKATLQLDYNRRRAQRCEITVLNGAVAWPKYGNIVNDSASTVMVDCDDFLSSSITYRHTASKSPQRDYVQVKVDLIDTQDRLVSRHWLAIPIHIETGTENQPPTFSDLSLLQLEVSQFLMTAITPDILSANDDFTPAGELVFKVKESSQGDYDGALVSTDDQSIKLTSFTQADIGLWKIAYRPPAEDSDEERTVKISLQVVDGEGLTSVNTYELVIKIKPKDSEAPIVTRNRGLQLFEGESRRLLSSENVQISDEDGVADVIISVQHGLSNGVLDIPNSRKFFTVSDLNAGSVTYRHDHSDTATDNIIFKASDGKHEIEFIFPITIIPIDDSAPVLQVNTGLRLYEGMTFKISSVQLRASDSDSLDANIRYVLEQPLSVLSQIVLRQRDPADLRGWQKVDRNMWEKRVTQWTQQDIDSGFLHYRHTAANTKDPRTDKIRFKLRDDNSPPNISPTQSFSVRVLARDINPPELSDDASLHLTVKENQVQPITSEHLSYTDEGDKNRYLLYTILSPLQAEDDSIQDVGQLVYTEAHDMKVMTFTQGEINQNRISYKPPAAEPGLVPRMIGFLFSVEDTSGNRLTDQRFSIFVQPVNDEPPVVVSNSLQVYQNGYVVVTPAHLDATDQDTSDEDISFKIEKLPSHGEIKLQGVAATEGSIFNKMDLENGEVMYSNLDADSLTDVIVIDVTDGVYHIPVYLKAVITPVEDNLGTHYTEGDSMSYQIEVPEGKTAFLTSDLLPAGSASKDLQFNVEVQPLRGTLSLSTFTMTDISDRKVSYTVRDSEIGTGAVYDNFNMTVAAGDIIVNKERIPEIVVMVKILPVDNNSPVISPGSAMFRVIEGDVATLQPSHLSIIDVDSETEDLVCTITTQPLHGYLELSSPAPGSEKSRSGQPISAFTINDLNKGYVDYRQSIHKGVEPVFDKFELICSDGVNQATKGTFINISISDDNDEVPVIHVNDFVVEEGNVLQIDLPILNIMDKDVPPDILDIKIVRKPVNGNIVTRTGLGTSDAVEFTFDDIRGESQVAYVHGGGENKNDSFVIEVTDGLHTAVKEIPIMVLPVDDEVPNVVTNQGLYIEAEVERPEWKFITDRELKSEDLDSPDGNITYKIRQQPIFGFLQRRGANNIDSWDNVTRHMTFQQWELDESLIRYVHSGRYGVRDVIKLDVSDGARNSQIDRRFYITVEALDRQYPEIVNRGLELPESQSVVLTTDMLSAWDDRSAADSIVFTVTEQPKQGQLELTSSPGTALTSFTQVDLAAGKVIYTHTGDERTLSDGFEFEVTDGFNPLYRAFSISIIPQDNQLPVLMIQPIRLREKGTAYITPNQIMARDRDTPVNDVIFTITMAPRFGSIQLSGVAVDTFTAADLENGLVTYQHNGVESHDGSMMEDSFKIKVSDGTHSRFFVYPNMDKPTRRSQEVKVQIASVDDSIPELVVNQPATYLTRQDQGLTSKLTNRHLKVKDADTTPDMLMYKVLEKPAYGRLLDNEGQEITSWTQMDINDERISYILNDDHDEETSDHFTFRVQDGGGNGLPAATFSLSWSFISFKHAMIEVAESVGQAEITLKRRGSPQTTAFVSVNVRDVTTMAGEDYPKYYAAQVQFNPGEYEKVWSIPIINDTQYEQKEMFTVELSSPVNSALEQHEWLTVSVTDEDDKAVVFLSTAEPVEIAEDIGRAAIKLKRSGDLSQEVITVCNFREGTSKGTDHPAIYTDFILRTSAVRFAAGQDSAECYVDIVDDSYIEPIEDFYVFIDKVEGGVIGEPSTSVLRILADPSDEPVVKFQLSRYDVSEGEGSVSVVIERSGGDLSKTSEVMLMSRRIGSSQATVMVDYIPVSKSIIYKPTEMIKQVKVVILDDRSMPMVEGRETFGLVLLYADNASIGHPNQTVITISDELDVPLYAFTESKYTISEQNTSFSVMMRRYGDISNAQTVFCVTTSQSARAAIDFVPRNSRSRQSAVLFKSGEVERPCLITLIDDSQYEGEETFELSILTDTVTDEPSTTTIFITDEEDKPTIGFADPFIYINEPVNVTDTVVARVKVVRHGDTSQTSTVRVYTRGGSAKSGLDYVDHTEQLTFRPGIKELTFEVTILHDGYVELRESFSVLMTSDLNNEAIVNNGRIAIYVTDDKSVSGLVFPVDPVVVSLKFYDNAKEASDPPHGYPVVCITPCDERHPEYARTRIICDDEGIDNSLTQYRWNVGEPIGRDGLALDLRPVSADTFMSSTKSQTLDSVFFGPGSRVQCVATASSIAMYQGLERESATVTINRSEGICRPRRIGSLGGEPYLSKVKYLGSDHKRYPNYIKLSVSIPHRDGMLPAISTTYLHNFEYMLSPDVARVGYHICSNLVAPSETPLEVGWNGRRKANEAFLPYQYDTALRGEKTVKFYSNLDLESCVWEFDAFFKLPELINLCGAQVETDSQVRDLTQSYVSILIPLFISYVFHSPVASGNWVHHDMSSKQRVTFVYDTALLHKQGVGNILADDTIGDLSSRLYLGSVRIQASGNLVVEFQTQTNFYGNFALNYRGVSSSVISEDLPQLSFDLKLVDTEETFDNPSQLWQFTSNNAVQDYTGQYVISLLPCTAQPGQVYSDSSVCTVRSRPLTFNMDLEIQQVSDPVAEVFSLNTELTLTRNKKVWLANNKTSNAVADVSFKSGEKIFGRVDSHQLMDDESPYDVLVEKVFICSGKDGFVPKYQPNSQEYGCVAESGKLQAQYKILDKSSPDLVQKSLNGVPFNAKFAQEDKRGQKLFRMPGTDGFMFDSTPLSKDVGRKWYVHVIYSVETLNDPTRLMKRHTIVERAVNTELSGVGNAKGTNMAFLFLEPQTPAPKVVPIKNPDKIHMWVIALSVVGVVMVVVIVGITILAHKISSQHHRVPVSDPDKPQLHLEMPANQEEGHVVMDGTVSTSEI